MNLLLEIVISNGLFVDLFGVLGLGLVAIAAVRLASRMDSRGGLIMSWGAISLLLGRLGILIFSQVISPSVASEWDPTLLALWKVLPLTLLSLGLGGIVLGFWGHERQLAGESVRR